MFGVELNEFFHALVVVEHWQEACLAAWLAEMNFVGLWVQNVEENRVACWRKIVDAD